MPIEIILLKKLEAALLYVSSILVNTVPNHLVSSYLYHVNPTTTVNLRIIAIMYLNFPGHLEVSRLPPSILIRNLQPKTGN